MFVVLPFLLISLNGFFAFPMGDDYTYALMGRKADLWTISVNEYNTWNGRFISNLLVVLNPIRWDNLILYRLIPAMLFLLFCCSIWALIRRFIRIQQNGLIASMFVVLYIQGMPIVSEGLYWYTGSVTYLVGIIFFNYWIYFVFLVENNKRNWSFLFLLLAAGCNEVLAIWCVLISALLIVKGNRSKFAAATFLLACATFCFIYFAPGNNVRASYFPNNHDFLHSSWMTFLQILRFSMKWLFSLTNLLLVLAILAFEPFRYVIEEHSHSRKLLFWIGVIFILLLASSIFPAYWSTGIMGQHRTVNLSYEVFLFAEMLIISFIAQKLKRLGEFRIYVLLGLFLSFFLTGNIGAITADLVTGRSRNFSIQMENRLDDFREKKLKACFPAISNAPKSLLNYELTMDTTNFKNTCYWDFFQLSRFPLPCKRN
jgi:hypothetical protein